MSINQDNSTWKCPVCKTMESGNFCSRCGRKKPETEDKLCTCGHKNSPDAKFCSNCGRNLDKRIPDMRILILCALLVIAVGWLLLKPHEHKWTKATCTDPETCQSCGETNGSAAGHKWKAATCTTAKTCKVCGETSGSASGHKWEAATCKQPKTCSTCGETSGSVGEHNWKPATYEAPETCRTCGKTRGEKLMPEGYIAKLSGSKEKVTLRDGYSTLNVHALVLSEKIENCKELTVNMSVGMKAGTHCSDWQLWGRTGKKFKKIGSIYLPGGDGDTTQTVTFSTPVSFDALVITPTIPGGYSWSLAFSITDVWVK